MIGRDVLVPRLVAFCGEPGMRYRYSGRDHEAAPWTPTLRAILDRLIATTGTRFHTVLCNHYRDGNDAMGRHADDEPELGPAPVIASVSLGAERRFDLRHRSTRETVRTVLPSGSVLVMSGATQRHWVHAVPRQARVREARINLTYRTIVEMS